MRRVTFRLVSGFLVIGIAASSVAQPVAIVDATIHTVSGDVLENATLVITDGRVVQVGVSTAIPANARRIDASGKVVTPGLIDLGTSIGLVEVGSLADTRDMRLDDDDPFRAAFRVRDGLNPSSIVIPVTRLGGVTTVASLPTGGVVSGQAMVMDLDGRLATEMIVREPAAMIAAFNPAAAQAAGGARGELSLRLREAFDDARFFRAHREAFDSGSLRRLSLSRLDLEALANVLDGEVPLFVRASRAADIDAALALVDEYGLSAVIVGGEEAWLRQEELKNAGTPVIIKAYANLPLQFDRLGTRFDNAALLSASGVRVVLSTLTTHNARNLRFEAGQAVRHGMSWHAALRAVTLTPAEVVGIAQTHGSIETGKIANVVVWSGRSVRAVIHRRTCLHQGTRDRAGLQAAATAAALRELGRRSGPIFGKPKLAKIPTRKNTA